MSSTLTRAFKFRPRLTEFEGRLTPSTGLDSYAYTPPPQNPSPATTDNDNMGTAPPGDSTNDGMRSAGQHDTTNDDMGSGDGDPDNGVSGTPPGNTNPPTGNPSTEGPKVIGGPGTLENLPSNARGFVLKDYQSGGDVYGLSRALPDGKVTPDVTTWDDVRRELAKAPAGSVGGLVIVGHGYGSQGGGLYGQDESHAKTGLLVLAKIDPATIDMIKSRLALGAPIILLGCSSCGGASTALQDLANSTGHPVIVNTGDVDANFLGTGNWVRYDPKN